MPSAYLCAGFLRYPLIMKALRNRVAGYVSILGVLAMVLYPSKAFLQHDSHSGTTPEGKDTIAHLAESDGHQHAVDAHHDADHHGDHHCHFSDQVHDTVYNATSTAFHHISDANVYSIGPLQIPLPCILYSKEGGWDVFLSSKFDFKTIGHGDGYKAVNKYVLDGGMVKRVQDPSFPDGIVELDGFKHENLMVDGKKKFIAYACYQGKHYQLDPASTADGGVFGGGITSFYDLSISKNVVSMLLVALFLGWVFVSIKKSYRQREGMAPKGMQSLLEPIILFIQDEVAKPFLGHKWEKFLPLLLSLFFFILGLNLFGQIPFFGGSNVTGNLGFTAVLAIIAFIVVTINGNKHYWEHILWMPGVPSVIKIIILTPVEILGMFIRPFTLMLRLFANITAGHIVILSFIGLIFIFGKMATSTGGVITGVLSSIPLTMFIMAIELLVAFIQAYVFTLLTASYLGAATEEHHHKEEHGAHH